MEIRKNIPTDAGCMGLINPGRYKSYHDGIFSSDEFLGEALKGNAVFWGVERGNWNIIIAYEAPKRAYQSVEGALISDGSLALCSYDVLTSAAMDEREKLPPEDCVDWIVHIPKGLYSCRISMLFDPETIREKDKFESKKPHFHIYLRATDKLEKMLASVHWYDFDKYI